MSTQDGENSNIIYFLTIMFLIKRKEIKMSETEQNKEMEMENPEFGKIMSKS